MAQGSVLVCMVLIVVSHLLIVQGLAESTNATESNKMLPNILMVVVDDLGWANVGYHRKDASPEVVTPNIDRLCKEHGLELDNFYTHTVCGPSRASLLSGRFAIHVNLDNGFTSSNNPEKPVDGYAGIPPPFTTISQKLKSAGYATHMVGKWDAGFVVKEQTPKGRGFDSSYGYLNMSEEYYTYRTKCPPSGGAVFDFWDTDKPADVDPSKPIYVETLFRKRLYSIVENHNPDQPLLLYFAPHIVHTPLEVPVEYLKKFEFIKDNDARRRYAAMVNYIDDSIGMLVDQFNQTGLWENTLMIFMSDNGGPIYKFGGANNYPLKGGKRSNFQGGIRVNAFVSGGYLPEEVRGLKKEGLMAECDWYTTLASIANVPAYDRTADLVGLPPVDGVDMSKYLVDPSPEAKSPRKRIYVGQFLKNGQNRPGGNGPGSGIIFNNWKLLKNEILYPFWTGPQYPNASHFPDIPAEDCGDVGCLYNLDEDPYEYNNLANNPDHQQVLRMMQMEWNVMMGTYYVPDTGEPDPLACTVAHSLYGGFLGPFRDYPPIDPHLGGGGYANFTSTGNES